MVGMCRIVGHRRQLIMLLLLLAQNLMNIILAHFLDRCDFCLFITGAANSVSVPLMHFLLYSSYAHDHSRSQKVIAYNTSIDGKEDMLSLCGSLISVLEGLELLSEVCSQYWYFAWGIFNPIDYSSIFLQQIRLG